MGNLPSLPSSKFLKILFTPNKWGAPANTHSLALRSFKAQNAPEGTRAGVFLSERRKPLHRSTDNLMLHKFGEKARLPVAVHPHMLRHACGLALADQGADTRLIQHYLGHRNIQHTVRYTATNPARFQKLWR